MSVLPVTVVIPVLNEELNLPACLEALGDSFEKIIVVDSDSTDRTGEIAEQAGVQILQFHWDGAYPKKRNWTLENIDFQTKWVLFLDADERVTPAFIDELCCTLPDTPHVGFQVTFTNWFMGRPLHHGDLFRKLPLFRVGSGAYEKFPENGWSTLDMEIHEHPVLTGTVGKIRARIEHHDFRSMEHYLKKHDEYAAWEANRHQWLQTAGGDAWDTLTGRQRIKYRLLDKPGLGWIYFCAAYFFKLGFLDGRAGFELARSKRRYFNRVRRKISSGV
jgi:glycosyltransferase involved in cell wall biosynthesis